MGGKGGTTINQPDPIDPGKATGEFLFGKDFQSYGGITDPVLQERIIGAEEQFRPRYAALELGDINTFAFGLDEKLAGPEFEAQQARVSDLEQQLLATDKTISTTVRGGARGMGSKTVSRDNPEYERLQKEIEGEKAKLSNLAPIKGQRGLFDILEESGKRAAELQRESLSAQREEDVAALQELSPQVVEAYRAADPASARLADLAAQQAEAAFERASGPMGFEAQRQVDQSVLGQLGGSAQTQAGRAALEAALGREQYQQSREQFAAGLGQGAFGQSRAIAGDLGAAILGRPSQGLALGQNVLGQSQQLAAGPMGPQLFDPNVGINMAMQQRSQDISLLGAQAQADAARSAGGMGALGSIGGALIGLCWVAREAYGERDGRWLQFRNWLIFKAPSWLRMLYLKRGKSFAKFISNKPLAKKVIRGIMNIVIRKK